MTHVVYKITNLINEKVYIGQTNDFDRRWSEHKSNAQNKPRQLVEQAMKKYGVDNFKCELIDTLPSQEEVNLKEAEYIKSNNCISPNGYNIEEGGKYAPLSQEALLKISRALKGRPSINKGKRCSEEQKLKTSKTMTGRKYSKDRAQKISEGRKGIPSWNKGKSKLTEEQVINIKNDNRLYKIIAEEYHISVSTVSVIKNK